MPTGIGIGLSLGGFSRSISAYSPSWNYSDSRNSMYSFLLIWW